MSEQPKQPKQTAMNEETLDSLLKLAGSRPKASEALTERVQDHVYQHWQAVVKKNKLNKKFLKLNYLIPASVAAVITLSWCIHVWIGAIKLNALPIASVQMVKGEVNIFESQAKVGINAPIYRGQTVHTDDYGQINIQFVNNKSLRMDFDTHVKFISHNEVYLLKGAVYIDSGLDNRPQPITVLTAFGKIRDIGTQFEARLIDDELRIRVREGIVELKDNGILGDKHTGRQGDEIVARSDRSVLRGMIDVHHPDWRWAENLSSDFKLNDRSLNHLLRWYCREKGLILRYANENIQKYAIDNIMHGSIGRLKLNEVLDVVSVATEINYKIKHGVLLVSKVGR